MSTIIDSIEQRQRKRVPRFDAGDRVKVHFQVIEGTRKRTQVFEGVVMKRQGNGLRETFTVRKQSFGVGVERTFPLHSPKIEKLEIAARGDVRRAKLYYLRDRVGKAARVAERRWGIDEDFLGAEEEGPLDAEGSAQEPIPEETVEAGAETEDAPEAEAEDAPEADADEAAEAPPAEAEDATPETYAQADAEPEANQADEDQAEAEGQTDDSEEPAEADKEAAG